MISFTWVLNTYGEPYSPSSLAGCTGYTGKYFTWSLLSVLVFYLLWIGVQLPQGEYISYGRGYLMVSIWCKVGYNNMDSTASLPLYDTVCGPGWLFWLIQTLTGRPYIHILYYLTDNRPDYSPIDL